MTSLAEVAEAATATPTAPREAGRGSDALPWPSRCKQTESSQARRETETYFRCAYSFCESDE